MQLRACAEAEGDPFPRCRAVATQSRCHNRSIVNKLINNILSAVALARTTEAFLMGAKKGVDPEVMLVAINA